MNNSYSGSSFNFIIKAIRIPCLFLLLFYTLYFGGLFLSKKYHLNLESYNLYLSNLKDIIIFLTVYWIIYNATQLAYHIIINWAYNKNSTLWLIVLPPLYSSINGALFIIMMNMFIFALNIPGIAGFILAKVAKILLILTIAMVFYKFICSIERYIINKYIEHNSDLNYSRKIHTQLTILKRVIVFLGVILTIVAITMLFDSIKGLGTSLLTTAGIISAVGAFASQQSLGRLFAGLQLAITQPMRIGDTVIIDNEFGQVEEITLSFITIKLWDLRRLILPTDYFTNKGLLNLTRESSELLGTIFIHADFTLPIDAVREHFLQLLQNSKYWNKQVGNLEVTDMKENTVEVRCLVSADDASTLWKLRCEIREKLINYIVENHRGCLTKVRNLNINQPSPVTMRPLLSQQESV